MNPKSTPKNVNHLYVTKAKESFKSRFDLLLFMRITNGYYDRIAEQELDNFRIEENGEVLAEYINIYWQKEDYKNVIVRGKNIDETYHEMKEWRENNKENIDTLLDHYVNDTFEKVFPRKEFEDFLDEKKECHYCHINKEQIDVLIEKRKLNKKKHTRGWSLEIDRIKPNHEYTRANCVWCCYWCNNAKTDEFSYDEFIKIGDVIKSIWDERLHS